MKFAAVLRESGAELPDVEDLFKKYKSLKKSLKKFKSSDACDESSDEQKEFDGQIVPGQAETVKESHAAKNDEAGPSREEDNFVQSHQIEELEEEFKKAIRADVEELNEKFMEKEELAVMKCEELLDKAEQAESKEDKIKMYQTLIDFHGDLLMLMHWSMLAYTGLVKILKKHHKLTGARLHAPELEHLLSNPFCSVEITCDLVQRVESKISTFIDELQLKPLIPAITGTQKSLEGEVGGTVASESEIQMRGSKADENNDANGESIKDAAPANHISTMHIESSLMQQSGRFNTHDKTTLERLPELTKLQENSDTKVSGKRLPIGSEPGREIRQKIHESGCASEWKDTETTLENQVREQDDSLSDLPNSKGTRRVKAALDVWEKLKKNASTPSTIIASATNKEGEGGGDACPAAESLAIQCSDSSGSL